MSPEGALAVEAARQRVDAAKAQADSARMNMESAKVTMQSAVTIMDAAKAMMANAQSLVYSSEREVEQAERCLFNAEGLPGIEDEDKENDPSQSDTRKRNVRRTNDSIDINDTNIGGASSMNRTDARHSCQPCGGTETLDKANDSHPQQPYMSSIDRCNNGGGFESFDYTYREARSAEVVQVMGSQINMNMTRSGEEIVVQGAGEPEVNGTYRRCTKRTYSDHPVYVKRGPWQGVEREFVLFFRIGYWYIAVGNCDMYPTTRLYKSITEVDADDAAGPHLFDWKAVTGMRGPAPFVTLPQRDRMSATAKYIARKRDRRANPFRETTAASTSHLHMNMSIHSIDSFGLPKPTDGGSVVDAIARKRDGRRNNSSRETTAACALHPDHMNIHKTDSFGLPKRPNGRSIAEAIATRHESLDGSARRASQAPASYPHLHMNMSIHSTDSFGLPRPDGRSDIAKKSNQYHLNICHANSFGSDMRNGENMKPTDLHEVIHVDSRESNPSPAGETIIVQGAGESGVNGTYKLCPRRRYCDQPVYYKRGKWRDERKEFVLFFRMDYWYLGVGRGEYPTTRLYRAVSGMDATSKALPYNLEWKAVNGTKAPAPKMYGCRRNVL